MAEVLGTVRMHRRGLLRWWWWPVGPKLVFDQMAASVLEINCSCCSCDKDLVQ
jgi:hypothetical protein